MNKTRLLTLLLTLLLTFLALSACGGDGDDDNQNNTDETAKIDWVGTYASSGFAVTIAGQDESGFYFVINMLTTTEYIEVVAGKAGIDKSNGRLAVFEDISFILSDYGSEIKLRVPDGTDWVDLGLVGMYERVENAGFAG